MLAVMETGYHWDLLLGTWRLEATALAVIFSRSHFRGCTCPPTRRPGAPRPGLGLGELTCRDQGLLMPLAGHALPTENSATHSPRNHTVGHHGRRGVGWATEEHCRGTWPSLWLYVTHSGKACPSLKAEQPECTCRWRGRCGEGCVPAFFIASSTRFQDTCLSKCQALTIHRKP